MRILHLSDLHVRLDESFDQDIVVEAALRDLGRLQAQTPVDLVVFTGDLAFAGRDAEFEQAANLLVNPLLERLGLHRERFVWVAGNHDMDVKDLDEFLEDGLRAGLRNRETINQVLDDQDKLARYTTRSDSWRRQHDAFYEEAPSVRRVDPLAHVHRLAIGESTVAVAVLHSAWRATGRPNDADKGLLLVGDHQVHAALRQLDDADLRLVALHHPLSWLQDDDAAGLETELGKHADVLLTGHTHEANTRSLVTVTGGYAHSAAGSLYQGRPWPNGFNVLDVDLSTRQLSVHVRGLTRRNEFDADTDAAPGGTMVLSLPPPPGSDIAKSTPRVVVLPGTAAARAAESLVQDARDTTFLVSARGLTPARIDDLYVPPVLYPLPFEQVLAVVEPLELRAKRVDPLEALGNDQPPQCLLVVGGAESGLTSALRWLIFRVYQASGLTKEGRQPLPLLVDFAAPPAGPRPLTKAVRRALLDLELNPETVGPLALAVDNVTPGKALPRLARQLAERGTDVIVLGCRPQHEAAVQAALEVAGLEVQASYLGPFGRSELRELARRADPARAPEVARAVIEMVRREGLTRTPSTMTALISVVSSAEAVTLTLLSETVVLDTWAVRLLGRDEAADDLAISMDHRDREHLLGCFAERLCRDNIQGLRQADAERFILDYFDQFDWSLPASEVINDLSRRRMLIVDAGTVRFRQAALLHLFAAKRLVEDSDFRSWALARKPTPGAVLRHAAALVRNAPGLLQAAGEELASALSASPRPEGADNLFQAVAGREGWNHNGDLEAVGRQLAPAPPPEEPDEQLDDLLDVLDSQVPVRQEPIPPEPKRPITRLQRAASLLSAVLRNSELVSDAQLRRQQLKQALTAWQELAALTAVESTLNEVLREIFDTAFEELGIPEKDRGAAVERILLLTPVLVAVKSMTDSMSSRKLDRALHAALADDEVMGEPGEALLAAALAQHLMLPEWPRHLQTVFDRHADRRVIAEALRFLAAHAYYSTTTSAAERTNLESLLADIALRGAPQDPESKSRMRGAFLTQLRTNHLQRRARDQLHATSSPLVLEQEEDPEPQGGVAELSAARGEAAGGASNA